MLITSLFESLFGLSYNHLLLFFFDHGICRLRAITVVLEHYAADRGNYWYFDYVVRLWDLPKSVRPELNSLKTVHSERELAHQPTDLVVFSFIHLDVQPSVRVLSLFDLDDVGSILSSAHHHALAQLSQLMLIKHSSKDTDPISSFHTVVWHLKGPC